MADSSGRMSTFLVCVLVIIVMKAVMAAFVSAKKDFFGCLKLCRIGCECAYLQDCPSWEKDKDSLLLIPREVFRVARRQQ